MKRLGLIALIPFVALVTIFSANATATSFGPFGTPHFGWWSISGIPGTTTPDTTTPVTTTPVTTTPVTTTPVATTPVTTTPVATTPVATTPVTTTPVTTPVATTPVTTTPVTTTPIGPGAGGGSPGTTTAPNTTQAIAFTSTAPTTPTVDGSYTVSAHGGGSGNRVVVTIDSSSTVGTCAISGSTVSFTGAGTCVIDANQAGSSSYAAAPQVQQSMAVTPAVPAAIAGLGYNLGFSDDFNSFNSSAWNNHIWYQAGVPGTVFATGGILHLQTTRADGWLNANAATDHKETWEYGYFEARMMWTGTPGAWPAFWLFSEAQRDGQTSASLLTSEADIQEGDGTDVDGYNTALHENTSSGFGVPDQTCPSDNWHSDLGHGDLADSWHTYGLLWTPTHLNWYLDGQLIASCPSYPSTNQPMFMLLTMGDGGALTGAASPPASAPAVVESEFDWVRVWQLP